MSNLVNWILKGKQDEQSSNSEDKMEDIQSENMEMLSPEELRERRLKRFSKPSNTSSTNVDLNITPPIENNSPNFSNFSQTNSNSLSLTPKSSPSTKMQSTLSPELRYIHDTISRICKVTLITRGTSAVFLEKMASSGKIYFDLEDIDRVLWEKALYSESPFFYSQMEMYNRIYQEISEVNDKKHKLSVEFRKNVLQYIEKAIVTYTYLYLIHPESFPDTISDSSIQEYFGADRGAAVLLKQLLVSADDSGYIPRSFFSSLVEVSKSNIKSIFNPLLTQILYIVKESNLNTFDWYPLLKFMELFSQIPEIALVMVQHPFWIPKDLPNESCDGKIFEHQSLLGVFFAIHGGNPKVSEHFFGGGKTLTLTLNEVNESKNTISQYHKNIQNSLKNLMLNLLRRAETREYTIKWIARVLEVNETRNRLRDDMLHSSTDGFMLNLLNVLLRLCDPFLDKMNTDIDPRYPMMNDQISVFKEETKILISPKDAVVYCSQQDSVKEFKFITSCYYLTLRAIHIGFIRTINKFNEYAKHQAQLQRAYENLVAEHAHQSEIAQIEPQLVQLWIRRWSDEIFILDTDLHQELFKFFKFSAVLLFKWSNISNNLTSVPNINELSMNYKIQPEHMIEDILDSITFIGRLRPSSLKYGSYDEIISYFIALLNFGFIVKNPYIRAKIPETIVFFVPSKEAPIDVRNIIPNHQLAQYHLMRGFMKLYVEIESTGASSQFYDKFTPRFWISIVMKSLWENNLFRESFKRESELSDPHDFMKFFNMLLNDSIYLLDESLKMLTDIHSFEEDLDNGRIQPNEMNERRRLVQQHTPALQSYMMLARETVNMMHYLSKDFPAPFLRPEMAPRVASMLNYFLLHLAGERCQNLKVKNAEKYHFKPKELITLLTETYMHFSKFDEFIKAVAGDERSYRPEILNEKVPSILRRIRISTEKFIQDFIKFSEIVQSKANEFHMDDVDYSDAPDEFYDPIMFNIMEDPVLLPSSKVIVDRATIERHLLNDSKDPFNRSELSVKDLIPQPELKKQIDEWKQSKKNQTKKF